LLRFGCYLVLSTHQMYPRFAATQVTAITKQKTQLTDLQKYNFHDKYHERINMTNVTF